MPCSTHLCLGLHQEKCSCRGASCGIDCQYFRSRDAVSGKTKNHLNIVYYSVLPIVVVFIALFQRSELCSMRAGLIVVNKESTKNGREEL